MRRLHPLEIRYNSKKIVIISLQQTEDVQFQNISYGWI